METKQGVEQLKSILDVITALSAQNYNVRAEVCGVNPDLDAVANGVNKLVMVQALHAAELNAIESSLRTSLKDTSDFKFALDASAIVAITDRSGTIIHANDNFCKISKYGREELLGRNHSIVNSGYHPVLFFNDLWSTILSGKIWKGEIRNKAKDGTIYWVDTTIVPLLDHHGVPEHFLAIRADISDRKRTEEQLKLANQELESFSYSVSHDLRSQLWIISCFTKIVIDKHAAGLNADGKELLVNVVNSATNLSHMIDSILKFSFAGNVGMALTMADMEAELHGVLTNLQYRWMYSNTKIVIGELLPHICDVPLVRHVWNNLLSNALKYSSKKSDPVVEIGSFVKDATVVYFVKDNGTGFDMKNADKLFLPFERLHATLDFEGSGIGLSLAHRIITRHGGTIWAEAEPGVGAAFYFTLSQV